MAAASGIAQQRVLHKLSAIQWTVAYIATVSTMTLATMFVIAM